MIEMKPKLIKLKSFLGKAIHPDFIEEDTDTYYLKSEVKLVVEWLKDKCVENPDNKNYISMSSKHLFSLIDEAFEDVVNQKQGEEDKEE